MFAIISKLVITEIRARVEKPVMDELGNRVKDGLTPDTEHIGTGAWAKLALCVGLDVRSRLDSTRDGPAHNPC